MRCDEIRALLDDYVDGSLARDVATRVDEHLAACPECSAELERLQRLLGLAADLPCEIAPSRDLWPTVAVRIAGTPKVVHGRFSGSWRRRLATAAAVLVAVGSLLIAYSLGRQHSGARSALAPTASPLAVPARLGDPTFAVAEAELIGARNQLLAALEARRSSMSPHTQRVVDDSLRLIDEAIARISVALVDDPLNPKLANQLAGAYRTEIELLQRVTALPAEI